MSFTLVTLYFLLIYLLLLIGTSDSIKEAAKHGHRGKNPARILKAVVDMMKEKYLTKKYDPLNIDEILKEIDLEELHSEIKQRLYEVTCTAKTST